MRRQSGLSCFDFAEALDEEMSVVAGVIGGHRGLSVRMALQWARKLGLPDATFVAPLLQDQINAHGVDGVALTVRGVVVGGIENDDEQSEESVIAARVKPEGKGAA